MKTYEMVALAEKDGCTYKTVGMRYSSKDGFHFPNGTHLAASRWDHLNGLQDFVLFDGWTKDETKRLTMEQLKSILGYDFEIVE